MIPFHWTRVGSIPVGLWAQECRTITLPSGAFCIREEVRNNDKME